MNKEKSKGVVVVIMLIVMVAGIMFTVQGINIHREVAVEEAEFHTLQIEYWSQAKTIRDAAPTGSELNEQFAEIMNTPSELLRLKLVGIGKMLTGIFILLLGILIALIAMPGRLRSVIQN